MPDCFVHASDLHLDAPLGNLGLLSEERRQRLAFKAEAAWQHLVDLCILRGASFLVLAGDIFDSAAAGFGAQRRLHDGLLKLSEHGVKVFICHGNHDPLSEDFHSPFELPDGVLRFPSSSVETHEVELHRSGGVVRISGISFQSRAESRNLARQFAAVPAQAGRPHVAVMHSNLGGDPNHDNYAACSTDDLSAAEVDYWALGHIHLRRVVELGAGRRAAYSGNLQGRSFKPSECEPKGALVISVEGGCLGEPEFVECDAVRFLRHSLNVSSEDHLGGVLEHMVREARVLGNAHADRPVAWRARLEGRSGGVTRGELQEHFAAEGAWREDSAWHDRLAECLNGGGLCDVEVAVRHLADREQIKASGDLRASVLEALDELRGADDPERLGALLSDMLPRSSGLRKVWSDNHSARLEDVVELAEGLLLEVLAGGESA